MKDDAPKRVDKSTNTDVFGNFWGSMTMGTSPVSTALMIQDWALHLSLSPTKQLSLARKAQKNWADLGTYVMRGCPPEVDAQPCPPDRFDRRFQDEKWSRPPFSAIAQAFLLAEDFVTEATTGVAGLNPDNDKAMTFLARQILDAFAPSNFLATNPEALARTFETKGTNLVAGAAAAAADLRNLASPEAKSHENPDIGKSVALSKGKVVLRTHLMELIQYEPETEAVHPEPIMIVPAWIMKYYILDLGRQNSLVRFLVERGFTVFMISWRNPDAKDADLGMSDYLEQGPKTALEHIEKACGGQKVHSVGYCLGGTLLSIVAAQLARQKDDCLASVTLLAAQTDFSEAGDLRLFINESQVAFLEEYMNTRGVLDSRQMMSAFELMRANDLIWSRLIHAYLMGEEPAPLSDLMEWSTDGTRMPARMHSEYLRYMFLNNDLASGRYKIDGLPVALHDITAPIFAIGTESDHIAPWKSVYKIHNLVRSDVTFVLTNGGHNAGVISEPGHKNRHFRKHTTTAFDLALTPEDWLNESELLDGSWWPAWADWLKAISGSIVAPPKMGQSLGDAPGTYVLQG